MIYSKQKPKKKLQKLFNEQYVIEMICYLIKTI